MGIAGRIARGAVRSGTASHPGAGQGDHLPPPRSPRDVRHLADRRGIRHLTMQIEPIDDYRWRLPKSGGMRVDGIVYADAAMMENLRDDQSLQQVRNVAHLPGIVGASLAMPDIHWGYGFPIGGVAATDAVDGVISPGGVGYDINCGVR